MSRLHAVPDPKPDAESAPAPISLDQAFRSYARYVGSIALRITADAGDVDDIVQDVFLEAQKGLRELRDPQALKYWLATITVRQASRRLRKRKARRFFGLERAVEYVRLLPPPARSSDLALLSDVVRVLDRISVDARIAWMLRHVEEEPLHRVAEICGVSRATAHRRVVEAREALQEAFEND